MKRTNKIGLILSAALLLPSALLVLYRYSAESEKQAESQLRTPNREDSMDSPSSDSDSGSADGLYVGEPVPPTLSLPVSQLSSVSADRLLPLDLEVNPRVSHQIENKDDISPFFAQDAVESAPLVVPSPQEEFIGESGTFLQPSINIAGSNYTGVNPPDTVGAVGKDHYIQMVNSPDGSDFLIYDKAGSLLKGATPVDALGSGNCADGGGDPIVLYDQLADRWFMTEFNSQLSLRTVCHYISQTADPLGSWYAYTFVMPSFPDYPKYGLWPSAYVGTANESDSAIYAFDREKMLAGDAAGFLRFAPPKLSGFGFQAFAPADLDGMIPPPAASLPLYLRHVDDEVHDISDNPSADFIEIWTLTPDFDTPGNSSFSQLANIPIQEFDSSVCGTSSFQCVPQTGSTRLLDPVREVLMHRVAYMNHGSHQSIVGNMVTDANGSDLHGIAWFELRNSNGIWELYQEGVLAPDGQHRWMGSIGMDASENIALLYNISSGTNFPSLFYTGRTADMPLGTLMPAEGVIGQGAAANGSSRYGDYTALTLDPIDGCTFWATGQYNPANNWGTRIASFKFPSCLTNPQFFIESAQSNFEFSEGDSAIIQALVSATDGFTETVSVVGGPASSGTVLAVQPLNIVPSPTPMTVTIVVGNAALGEQTVLLTGSTPSSSQEITLTFTMVPTLTEPVLGLFPPEGDTYVPVQPRFEWSPIAGATSYELEIAEGSDFSFSTVYTSLISTQFDLPITLLTETTYSWRVRPINKFSQGPWVTQSFITAPPAGQCMAGDEPVVVYETSFETLDNWQLTGTDSDQNWILSSDRLTDGESSAFAATQSGPNLKQMTSPTIILSAGADARWLRFDLWRDIEASTSSCFDGLLLEATRGEEWASLGDLSTNDPYDKAIPLDLDNPLSNQRAWCGTQDWTTNIIDLATFSGTTNLRFSLGSDQSVNEVGANIDKLTLFECNPTNQMYFFPAVYVDGVAP